MRPVYLVCGVPGSGKTWVCSQLTDKFNYIPHDNHPKDIQTIIKDAAMNGTKTVITECPFGERSFKEFLEAFNIVVIPLFIVEEPKVVQERYFKREGKELYKAGVTRATTIKDRAKEWNAVNGTSSEILEYLKKVQVSLGKGIEF